MVARMWRGATTHADAALYARYVADTGMAAYRATPGNRGAHLLQREVGDLTEIVTLSFWSTWTLLPAAAARAFSTVRSMSQP